jgi:uncharacterized protein YdeI (YjbR/CyaY-like superfamily)
MAPTFFPTPADWCKWLETHHATARELLVGFYKRGSGRPSITWPESVDEALCFGWIDGVRKRIDDVSYTIRFTPRKARSIWSNVNVRRVVVLAQEGRMRPAGLAAYEARRENKSGVYSYEKRPEDFPDPYGGQIRKNKAAWTFFQAQPPSYRRAAIWWVVSAKKEETRLKRLGQLIEDSANGRRLAHLIPNKPSGPALPRRQKDR